ncbi:MAG: biopolymer transporter Tol [Pirellula sp.]|nr:biopolymer transporter Tol [Pirellula sp.]
MSLSRSVLVGAVFVVLAHCRLSPAAEPGKPADAATTAPSIESQFLSNMRQVTSGFTKAGEGYFSPDGKQIVYQAVSTDYPFYQIYTQPLQAAGAPFPKPKLISTGRGRTTCAYFSPDGKKILFASSHLDPDMSKVEEAERKQQAEDAKAGRRRRYEWPFDPATDIFEVSIDGGPLKRLTDAPGYDAEGAYSKDGSTIVFCSTRDGDPDLYVMKSDGSDVRQLTNEPGYDGGPFQSPDGKWVVYRTDRKKAEHLQIHVIGIDGKHDTAVTDDPNSVFWAPYWHPTEPYIIWTGADHSDPTARPNYDLWLMKYEVKDGEFKPGKRWRVTDHPTGDVLPVFSPDGKQLMWTSNRTPEHQSQLFIADFKLPE